MSPFFKTLCLCDVQFTEEAFLPSERERERLRELKLLHGLEGLLPARKKLSRNGNFARDYGVLWSLVPWTEQPAEVVPRDLRHFFAEGGVLKSQGSMFKQEKCMKNRDCKQCELGVSDVISIGAAAKILGVHPDTLRRWEKRGVQLSRRHPINGYRLYRLREINELKAEYE